MPVPEAILALDIGNGSIKYALFRDGQRAEGGRLALGADSSRLPEASRLAAVSVNPPELERLRRQLPALQVVGEDLPLGIPVLYDPPGACGTDRVMSAVGALHRRSGAPGVLVLDAGTCLTSTVAIRGIGVVGGAILPGVDLMMKVLAEGTARLPEVSWEPPEAASGASTAASMRSGVWAAWVGAAREIIRRSQHERSESLDVVVAGTGAEALAAHLAEVDAVVPDATLWGVFRTATS